MAVTRSAWPQCSPTWSLSPLSPCTRSSLSSSSPCVMCLIRSRQLVGYLCLDSEWSLAIRAVLVPSYQLRAHMKFNQIPSASLHNSDCWSCTAAAAREQYQLRGPPCPSVSPSLHGLMMVEDRAATSIRHCPAWILCPACDRDVLQVIHISWNVLDIHLSTSNIQFLSSFKHLVKF